MDQVLRFLKKERVCVLGTISKDGVPETAVLHFSHQENPLVFFFQTTSESRKYQNALKNIKASCVVGWSEEEFITVQMNGVVKPIKLGSELESWKKIHYDKHPEAKQYEHDDNTVFLTFTPHWLKYSDFKTDPVTEETFNI